MKKIAFILMAMAVISCNSSSSSSSKTEDKTAPEAVPAMYVALSFDDGPNNITTPKVLDILEAYDAPASFFVIGQNIDDSTAEQMKRAVKLGCEIQNHSYTHSFMSQMTAEEIQSEIQRTDEIIEKYIGVRPWLFRPPFIDHNEVMHQTIGHTFICGVGCEDWVPERTAQERYDILINTLKDGDIVLLHDLQGNDNTVEALKMLIPEMKKQGYTFVTVTELYKRKGVNPAPHNGVLYSNVLQ